MWNYNQIVQRLKDVARQYPAELSSGQMADVARIAFNISLSVPPNKPIEKATICDIGGGIGLFSVGCAALGFANVVLVDDFRDEITRNVGESVLFLHRKYGVTVISRDVIAEGIGVLSQPIDVMTSFDSMEHWHNSPKRLFHDLVNAMTPGGRFVLGVPNCVNLRKRLTVPFGRGKWSAMADWYECGVFRGHVREPDAADLIYIANDLGLRHPRLIGRNWLGRQSGNATFRLGARLLDPLLRLRPSLCSNVYLTANKS